MSYCSLIRSVSLPPKALDFYIIFYMHRASQQEMINNAERETNATGSTLPSGMRSTLVENAQPMSYSGPPKTAFDSCV